MKPRTIAIGDIHGCSAALDALLEAIRPRPEDCIVTLGDYINRGPDSRGVIERLIELKDRCRLVPLLGNHEEMLFEALAEATRSTTSSAWAVTPPSTLTDPTVSSHSSRTTISSSSKAASIITKPRLTFSSTPATNLDLPMDEQTTPILRWEPLGNSVPERHFSGKTVIAGHTSQKNGEILDLGHVKVIDTYCYGGGWLTALDVQTEEVWQADREGNLRRR